MKMTFNVEFPEGVTRDTNIDWDKLLNGKPFLFHHHHTPDSFKLALEKLKVYQETGLPIQCGMGGTIDERDADGNITKFTIFEVSII